MLYISLSAEGSPQLLIGRSRLFQPAACLL